MNRIELRLDADDALLVAECGGIEILRYNSGGDAPCRDAPKPFFHPVRTLSGRDICVAAPADHCWHAGIWLSFSGVAGVNFWGGPTYVRDQGYVDLDNHGRISHLRWLSVSDTTVVEELEWTARNGERLLLETREISVAPGDQPAAWTLLLSASLHNATHRELLITSPGSEGRPEGGYGGLAWRGTAEFSEFLGTGHQNPSGTSCQTLGMRTRDGSTTVAITQSAGDARHPDKWFARNEPYPLVACSPVYNEPHALAPAATLMLGFSFAILG